MLVFALLLLACGSAVAFYRWRWGLAAALLFGLLQDPLRKMMPGTPGAMTMYTLPVLFSALLSAYLSGELCVHSFLQKFPRLNAWLKYFGLYLVIPAALSLSYGQGTWQITILGIVVYGMVFLTVIAGYAFSQSRNDVSNVLAFYAVITGIILVGGLLEYSGYGEQYAALGTQVLGNIWVTYRTGEALFMYAGFFRGPDIMGWHAALVAMIASFLALKSRGWMRFVWIALCIWGLFNVWICGRRKMISMLPVFWSCFMLLSFRFSRVRWIVPFFGVLLLIMAASWYLVIGNQKSVSVDAFYLTTVDEFDDRLLGHGVKSVLTTIQQAGILGYGLGMGQQGIHHINAEKPRLWQEGGPGKVVVELGVPGGILFLGVLGVLVITALHVVGQAASTGHVMSSMGILSLIIANLASSIVSAQVFGDPFIMLLLAFMTGLLFSESRVCTKEPVQKI